MSNNNIFFSIRGSSTLSITQSVKYEEETVRKALSEVSGGGIRTVNVIASEDQCNTICEEFDLQEDVCKSRKSNCQHTSNCFENGTCTCKVSLDCGPGKDNNSSSNQLAVSFEGGSYDISKVMNVSKNMREGETKKIQFISSKSECQDTCSQLEDNTKLCPTNLKCKSDSKCQNGVCNCSISIVCKSSKEEELKGLNNDEDYLSNSGIENDTKSDDNNTSQGLFEFGENGYNSQAIVDHLNSLMSPNKTLMFQSEKEQCLNVCKDLKNGQKVCKSGASCMTQNECSAKKCTCTLRLFCKIPKGQSDTEANKTKTTSEDQNVTSTVRTTPIPKDKSKSGNETSTTTKNSLNTEKSDILKDKKGDEKVSSGGSVDEDGNDNEGDCKKIPLY